MMPIEIAQRVREYGAGQKAWLRVLWQEASKVRFYGLFTALQNEIGEH